MKELVLSLGSVAQGAFREQVVAQLMAQVMKQQARPTNMTESRPGSM